MTGARLPFAAALLVCLGLLRFVAPGGDLPLTAAALALALGAVRPPPRRVSRSLRAELLALCPTLSVVTAVSAVAGSLLMILARPDPAAAVAWLGSAFCVGSAAWLGRTPAPALPLHALPVTLGVWTAAALAEPGQPPAGVVAATLTALGLLGVGLTLARSGELEQSAAASITVGVAPTPWGVRPRRLPVLLVVLLALGPLALGLSLPRLSRSSPSPAARSPARPSGPSPRRRDAIGFAGEVDAGLGRGALESRDALIARVRAEPAVASLLVRGSILARVTERGFAAGESPLLAAPPGDVRRLDVEQLLPLEGFLLTTGAIDALTGVPARPTASGWRVVDGEADYPLRYQLTAREVFAEALARADLPAAEAPRQLELPPSLAGDPDLRQLAEEVAWGRSPLARARHAMAWLAERCQYHDAHPLPPESLRARLRRFLLEERRGVCTEFAGALVVLLRHVDVPARLVTGFRSSERGSDGSWIVRQGHAHAWVELGLAEAGWVAVDPTPASPGPLPVDGADVPPAAPEDGVLTAVVSAAEEASPLLVLAAASLALALLAALSGIHIRRDVVRRHLRRDGHAPELSGPRRRLFALLTERGFRLDGSQTPLEFLTLRRRGGRREPALEEAVLRYTALRFSGRIPPEERRRWLDAVDRAEHAS